MMDRAPTRKSSPVEEPDSNEDGPLMTGREDQVLDLLHQCTDGNPRKACGPDTKASIHKEFEACEAYETYLAYNEGSIPTIESIAEGIESALLQAPQQAKEGPEAERITKMLSGRAMQIRAASRSYVQSVIAFNRQLSGAGQFRFSEEEKRNRLVDADKRRRRLHDSLLDTLRVTHKTLMDAVDIGILRENSFGVWARGFDARQLPGSFTVFAPKAIDDRDLIRNWAIAADFAQTFAKLEEIVGKSGDSRPMGA